MQPFSVPGHEVRELLGYGAAGEVWRARRGVELVVLRRLSVADPAALQEVRRQATVVRTLTSRHLLRLKTTTKVQGDDVLVLDHAACGSLESLLADRGTLTPGEVVTVLAPLAEALGQAHAHDLRHRRLRASRVLFGEDGRPMLDGLGLGALYDPKDSLDPTGALGTTADVWALGALGHLMLTGREPGHAPEFPPTVPLPLKHALEAALDLDPMARPSAEDLAARLLASCPAAPVTGLPEPVALPKPQPRQLPRRIPRPLILGGAAAVALLAVVLLGWTWGARSAPATASVKKVPTDWAAVVRGLDQARTAAFSTGGWSAVYANDTGLRSRDEATRADLTSRHLTPRGLGHRLRDVKLLTEVPDRVQLVVTQQLDAYTLVDPSGHVLERHTAGPVQDVVMVLHRTRDGWRVEAIRADS